MLLLPMTYFAAGKAKKRVILVGDFQQLPSIISSDKDIVQKWLNRMLKNPFQCMLMV